MIRAICVTIHTPEKLERPRFSIYTCSEAFPLHSLLEKMMQLGWISIRPDAQDDTRGYYLLIESEAMKSCFEPVRCTVCNEFMYAPVRTTSNGNIIGICGCSGLKLHKHAQCVANDIIQRKSALCKFCGIAFVPENAFCLGDGIIISNALDFIGYTGHGEFDFPESFQDEVSYVKWHEQFSPKTQPSQIYDHDNVIPDDLHEECMQWISSIYENNITPGIDYLIHHKSRKHVWIFGFHMDDPECIDWVACLVTYGSSQYSWFLIHIQSIENNITWALRSVRMILARSTIQMYCYKTDLRAYNLYMYFFYMIVCLYSYNTEDICPGRL
jgi:hypothetical protein